MAILQYSDIGIRAVAACVPEKIVPNSSLTPLLPSEELEKTINLIGIREKRYAGSTYASLANCTRELQQAKSLFLRHNIKTLNVEGRSIEEISVQAIQAIGLTRRKRSRVRDIAGHTS